MSQTQESILWFQSNWQRISRRFLKFHLSSLSLNHQLLKLLGAPFINTEPRNTLLPVDGQGWVCPLSQSEWTWCCLLFLLSDWAWGMGARRWSLVRKASHLLCVTIKWNESKIQMKKHYHCDAVFSKSTCRRFAWVFFFSVPGMNM